MLKSFMLYLAISIPEIEEKKTRWKMIKKWNYVILIQNGSSIYENFLEGSNGRKWWDFHAFLRQQHTRKRGKRIDKEKRRNWCMQNRIIIGELSHGRVKFRNVFFFFIETVYLPPGAVELQSRKPAQGHRQDSVKTHVKNCKYSAKTCENIVKIA